MRDIGLRDGGDYIYSDNRVTTGGLKQYKKRNVIKTR